MKPISSITSLSDADATTPKISK